ncbi:unnamed protein product [Nezara viridula]|uniref:Cyclin-dependent kinase 2-interacting protein n=1 Tax=Nezara viridula TaxID=85310 RepID=A0A9P0MSS8_NEZVI|nr:unnamed protein product [Nezara viridula]
MSSPISNPRSPSTFSPVSVVESPITAQKGQLRGTPRTVRDAVAELFNNIQEWNRLHISGMSIIQEITSKKLESINKKESGPNMFPEGLQVDCNKLDSICAQLESVVKKMEKILNNFKAIEQLEEMNKTGRRSIFTTWNAEKYVSAVKAIFEAYDTEVKVKCHIKENIAHVDGKDKMMLHCALWAHQPYVDNVLDFYLESMLKETGHR